MTRKEVIAILNQEIEPTDWYERLKECFIPFCYDQRIDKFFGGFIKSLYYYPNIQSVCLVGKQGIGKTEFWRRIFPVELQPAYIEVSKKCDEAVYNRLLCNFDEFTKQMSVYTVLHDFRLVDASEGCNKRMCSYVSSLNHLPAAIPQRKNVLFIKLEDIDKEKFMPIDKLQLWIELYHKFKPAKARKNEID